jgi:hypothetical protein
MCGFAIAMDSSGGNGQWQRDSNLIGDSNGNVIALGNGGGDAMDSWTAAQLQLQWAMAKRWQCNGRRQWRQHNHNWQRRQRHNGWRDSSVIATCGIVIAMIGGSSKWQQRQGIDMMQVDYGIIIAMDDCSDSAMDGGMVAQS